MKTICQFAFQIRTEFDETNDTNEEFFHNGFQKALEVQTPIISLRNKIQAMFQSDQFMSTPFVLPLFNYSAVK